MILPSSINKSCQPKRDNMFGGNVGVEEITFLMEESRTSYSATLSPWTSPNSFGQPGVLSDRVSVLAESSANVVWSLTPPKPSTSTCRKIRRDELTRQASGDTPSHCICSVMFPRLEFLGNKTDR